MVKPLFTHRGYDLVPMQEHHVIPFFNDIAPYSLEEYGDHEDSMLDILYSMQKDAECFIVEKDGVPIWLVGLQPIGNQEVFMFSSFTNQMKKNWLGVVKFSPRVFSFIHETYYEINLHIESQYEGAINWMLWIGFTVTSSSDDELGNTSFHFVRCNPNRKNVYALPSRPVMH